MLAGSQCLNTATPKGNAWALPDSVGKSIPDSSSSHLNFAVTINQHRSDNYWNIGTLPAMGTPTHPRAFSERLPNDPTTSPRVQKAWPRKSCRVRDRESVLKSSLFSVLTENKHTKLKNLIQN